MDKFYDFMFALLTYGGVCSVSTTKLFISSSSLFSSGCDTSGLQPRFFSRFETKKETAESIINIKVFKSFSMGNDLLKLTHDIEGV